eukprot:1413699-Amphidinium_carterae.1
MGFAERCWVVVGASAFEDSESASFCYRSGLSISECASGACVSTRASCGEGARPTTKLWASWLGSSKFLNLEGLRRKANAASRGPCPRRHIPGIVSQHMRSAALAPDDFEVLGAAHQ